MPEYTLSLTKAAAKYLERCDAAVRERLKGKLDRLETDPFDPQQSKSLRGRGGERSARVGDLRILFLVQGNSIVVASIDSRGQVYKHGTR